MRGARKSALVFQAGWLFGCGAAGPSPDPLLVVTTSLPAGEVGVPYESVLRSTGGRLEVRWSVRDGQLPAGLALDPDGRVAGIPESTSGARFTVQARSGAEVAVRELALVVTARRVDTAGFGGTFVRIPAGRFVMGSDTRSVDERPSHEVRLASAFMLGTTEVTQAQWQRVMGNRPSYFAACGATCPVEQVSWDDVQVFLDRLNALDPGKGYRLPTEAEWEYAARAGTTGDYGGSGVAAEMGWYYQNSGQTPHPVGGKAANAWGLYDMHGNVAEWVEDWYGSGYYPGSPPVDPRGPAGGEFRVVRGGSWLANTVDARSSARFQAVPGDRFDSVGFRIARSP